MDFYIAECGITPDLFWRSTWKENDLMAEHHLHTKFHLWELVRFNSTLIYNTSGIKKGAMIKPHQMFKLPQDNQLDIGKPKSTKDEYQAFVNKVKNFNRPIKNPLDYIRDQEAKKNK